MLTFILVTIIFAIIKLSDPISSLGEAGLFGQISPSKEDMVVLMLFHNSERCNQCLMMERYARELLNNDYRELVANNDLQLMLITMDTGENMNLVKRFDLYTSSFVIVRFEGKKDKEIKILRDAWEYLNDESSFKEMLRLNLDQFIYSNE